MASVLGKAGASRIYILGRRLSALEAATRTIGPAAIPVECDVTKTSSVSAVVAKVEKEVGYVDVLINNAGVSGPDDMAAGPPETIEELQNILLANQEGWASTFAINTTAIGEVSVAFLKLLDAGNRRRGWEGGKIPDNRARRRETEGLAERGIALDDQRSSQIITVASISGLNRRIASGLAYGASKAGAIHLSKMLAHLLVPWGIRSNVINPGGKFTSTSIRIKAMRKLIINNCAVYPSAMSAGIDDYSYKEIPAGRTGTFHDIAGIILYLVGKGGAYLNGSMVNTDGGRASVMPAAT